MINVETKLIALLGNPLGQSMSAKMQNAAFEARGVNFVYFPIETTEKTLPAIVQGIRCMNFAGFGVTKPDKVEVIKLLDRLDPFAEKMGAVNTAVVEKDGSLTGYNTDGVGFIRSLKECYKKSFKETKILCLGAGGAARAICCSLAYEGAGNIVVSSLFDTDSQGLIHDINSNFAPVSSYVPWADKQGIAAAAADADILINATGVGMGAHIGESPVDKAVFHKGMLAFDAAYNPAETKFLADAREAGCATRNGLGMLLYQGTAQFEMWTGKEAPVALMKGILEESIGTKA